MTEEQTFTLPKLPQLIGEENLEEWKAAINHYFKWHRIRQYLTTDVPQPPIADANAVGAWEQARLKGIITIHSTLTNKTIRNKLRNAGWNPLEEENPKTIYDLVLRVIPSTSEEAVMSLYLELSKIDRAKYDSLSSFQDRVTYLKGRLETLKCPISERGCVILVVGALKNTYPDWYNFLYYDFEKGDLTWTKLMEDISKRANQELSDMTLLTTRSTKPSNTNQQQSNTSQQQPNKPTQDNNKADNTPKKKIHCSDCGYRHFPDFKWCEQCKQHESDKWIWCSICKRHHGVEYWKCKAKEGISDTPNTSNRASAGALNTTTGLPIGSNTITRLSQMALRTELFEKQYIDRDTVLLDTACFNHIFNSKRWFIEYEDIDPLSTGASNGGTGVVIGRGTIRLPLLLPNGQSHTLELPNTIYQPATPCNLLSAGQLERNRIVQDGFNKTICFQDTKQILGQYVTVDNVFAMITKSREALPAFAMIKKQPKVDYTIMYRRLLHCSHNKLIAVAKEMGITYSQDEYKDFDCDACHAAKGKMTISRDKVVPVQYPLHEIHVNTIHYSKLGVYNLKYSTYMLDIYTGYHWIFFLRNMRDVADKVINWGIEIQNLTNLSIYKLFINGGKEFLNIKQWAAKGGIQIRNTPPNIPEPRGRIERAGGIITAMARTAMIDADLPPFLWPYAEAWAVKILNILPATANDNNESPYSKMAQALDLHKDLVAPFISHIRIFGAIAWLLLKESYAPAKGDKLAPRAIKGRYLGAASRKGHVVYIWIPSTHRLTTARDVTIVEKFEGQEQEEEQVEEPEYIAQWESDSDDDSNQTKRRPKAKESNNKATKVTIQDIEPEEEEDAIYTTPPATPHNRSIATQPIQSTGELATEQAITEQATPIQQHEDADLDGFFDDLDQEDHEDLASEEPVELDTQQVRRSIRSTNRPDYKTLHTGKPARKPIMVTLPSERQVLPTVLALSTIKAMEYHQIRIPKSYYDARKSSIWEQWKPAFIKQINDLQARDTWDLVDRLPDMDVLPGKWVLDVKLNAQGEWERNRARWVVCGNYENTESWAAQDVYAAVANSASVKLFFTLVAINDYECYQYDIVTAFLNAYCKGETIYVEQPHGFTDGTRRVCRVKRALYGLRKAPLWWFETICEALKKHGFEPMTSDMCLFKNDKLNALLILYVDDVLIAAPSIEGIHEIREILASYYELKEFGEVQEFLGIAIVRDRKKKQIFLHQRAFTERILERFGYTEHNAVSTPWNSTFSLPTEWEKIPEASEHYSQQTGSINYLSCHTRPDITFTSNRLASGNCGPSPTHWKALQHLFRYLIGTKELGILLGGQYNPTDIDLKAYCDAAYADDLYTRYSTAGHIIFVAGGPIYWTSKKQTLVTLSTTEAEFINITPTGCSLIWIKSLLQELGYSRNTPELIFTDSANALAMALNP